MRIVINNERADVEIAGDLNNDMVITGRKSGQPWERVTVSLNLAEQRYLRKFLITKENAEY